MFTLWVVDYADQKYEFLVFQTADGSFQIRSIFFNSVTQELLNEVYNHYVR